MSIPLTTPPGTKIVCVRDEPPREGWAPLPALIAGEVYTLGAIEMGVRHGAGVILQEVTHPIHPIWQKPYKYYINRFRLAVTPEGLLSVPSEAPADLDRRTAPVSPRKRVRA